MVADPPTEVMVMGVEMVGVYASEYEACVPISDDLTDDDFAAPAAASFRVPEGGEIHAFPADFFDHGFHGFRGWGTRPS